jgi:hypothetical protein
MSASIEGGRRIDPPQVGQISKWLLAAFISGGGCIKRSPAMAESLEILQLCKSSMAPTNYRAFLCI